MRLVHAIEFQFQDVCLTVFNTLNENGLENELLQRAEFNKWSVL